MDNSKIDKNTEQMNHIVRKLEKLRVEITECEDYLCLEKLEKKYKKIQTSVNSLADRRLKKELKTTCDICEGLIKEKTKFFKRKIIKQLNNSQEMRTKQAQKTLKYSKSVQNFNLGQQVPLQTFKRRKNQIEYEELSDVHEKTQVYQNNNSKAMQNLREDVQFYKKRVLELEIKASIQPNHNPVRKQEIIEQYNYKIREKGLQIEELRGKIKYHEETNQELKNRLLNEQRRQDDYIISLKRHIDSVTTEIELLKRENKKLADELEVTITKYQQCLQQVGKLRVDLKLSHNEKNELRKNDILKMKDDRIKRQLQNLSLQDKYISEVEGLLENEKMKRLQLEEQMVFYQSQNENREKQMVELERDNQKLQENIEIRQEELEQTQQQLIKYIQCNKRFEEEIVELRTKIIAIQQSDQQQKFIRDLGLKAKVEKLKQIKDLLSSQ